ncbi:hypothetical protein BgiBS90_005172 [Biomphalaria glabrata]|nr:hypothetical protein BgiBS90_005172 [Biomphalaria glabrata]
MNVSNLTLDGDDFEIPEFMTYLLITFKTMFFVTIVLGTLLNLWLLLAIVTCPEMRSRIRNKLIVSNCVLYLVQCLVEGPLDVAALSSDTKSCSIFHAVINIMLMLDFVSNYTLLTMVIVFVLQLMDLKLSVWMSELKQLVVTLGVLLIPWVASLLTIPAMVTTSDKYIIFADCPIPRSYLIFRIVNTIVPLMLAAGVSVAAALMKRRRFSAGLNPSGMQVELLSPGPEMDEAKTYLVAVAVSFLCDIGVTIMEFDLGIPAVETRIILGFSTVTLETIRPVVMALPWLLFNDIRQRLKTWRPWYRPEPGIDLTQAQGGQHEL